MDKEKPQFSPYESEDNRMWQEHVVEEWRSRGVTIDHDAEYFRISLKKPDGATVVHLVPKHSGAGGRTMVIKGFSEPVPREKVIEAIVKTYPELYQRGEEPSLTKALEMIGVKTTHR